MKLLILTQIVDKNDPVLGFFHDWIKEFARQCEKVTVICLKKGDFTLPDNVKVLSLGKEQGRSKLKYLFNFYKYIFKYSSDYDRVFVHMNPEYVVLGGVVWHLMNKKIGLWYAHGTVNLKLRIAEKLTDTVFTSTKKGFRLPSKKLQIIGQGIDTRIFSIKEKTASKTFKIINTGRISPAKDYETLIKAIELLHKDKEVPNFSLEIIGGPGLTKDKDYLKKLEHLVTEKNLSGIIKFLGPKPPKQVAAYLQTADLFISATRTGSLDKSVLEAMACGLPIISSCEALTDILSPEDQQRFMFQTANSRELYKKIKQIMAAPTEELKQISENLRKKVIAKHSLEALIIKIIT